MCGALNLEDTADLDEVAIYLQDGRIWWYSQASVTPSQPQHVGVQARVHSDKSNTYLQAFAMMGLIRTPPPRPTKPPKIPANAPTPTASFLAFVSEPSEGLASVWAAVMQSGSEAR